jgi:hypothetical protein
LWSWKAEPGIEEEAGLGVGPGVERSVGEEIGSVVLWMLGALLDVKPGVRKADDMLTAARELAASVDDCAELSKIGFVVELDVTAGESINSHCVEDRACGELGLIEETSASRVMVRVSRLSTDGGIWDNSAVCDSGKVAAVGLGAGDSSCVVSCNAVVDTAKSCG